MLSLCRRPLFLGFIAAFLWGFQSRAQFIDSFDDGDFTQNPTWVGTDALFKVNTAKQLVSGKCAIDTPAGPSEILIIADRTAKVDDLLLDFTAQIEHGPDNVGVLVCDSKPLVDEFETRFSDYVKSCKRSQYIESSAEKFGLIVETENLEDSITTLLIAGCCLRIGKTKKQQTAISNQQLK